MKKYTLFSLVMAFLIIGLSLPAFVGAYVTTETSTHAAKSFPVYGPGHAGTLKSAYGTLDLTVTPGDGYIYEMCRVPANAIVVGGVFYAEDLDIHGTETLDMDVGWAANGSDAADPDGFLNAGVLTGDAVTGYKPEAGTYMPFGGVLLTAGSKQFAKETVIQIEGNAAAATFAPGRISIRVDYLID